MTIEIPGALTGKPSYLRPAQVDDGRGVGKPNRKRRERIIAPWWNESLAGREVHSKRVGTCPAFVGTVISDFGTYVHVRAPDGMLWHRDPQDFTLAEEVRDGVS